MILCWTEKKAEAETLLFPSVTEKIVQEKGYIEGFATELWLLLFLAICCVYRNFSYYSLYGMVHYKSFRIAVLCLFGSEHLS